MRIDQQPCMGCESVNDPALKEGRISVDVSFGILSALGTYLTAAPFWHELARVTHHHLTQGRGR